MCSLIVETVILQQYHFYLEKHAYIIFQYVISLHVSLIVLVLLFAWSFSHCHFFIEIHFNIISQYFVYLAFVLPCYSVTYSPVFGLIQYME